MVSFRFLNPRLVDRISNGVCFKGIGDEPDVLCRDLPRNQQLFLARWWVSLLFVKNVDDVCHWIAVASIYLSDTHRFYSWLTITKWFCFHSFCSTNQVYISRTAFLGMAWIHNSWNDDPFLVGTQTIIQGTLVSECYKNGSDTKVLDESIHCLVVSLCRTYKTLLARFELSREMVVVCWHASGDSMDTFGGVLL